MKLKCIGGEFDGNCYEVYDHLRIGDLFKINKPQISAVITEFPPKTIEIEIEEVLYRKCIFMFSKDDAYFFLAPQDWTDKQAIIHQFSK